MDFRSYALLKPLAPEHHPVCFENYVSTRSLWPGIQVGFGPTRELDVSCLEAPQKPTFWVRLTELNTRILIVLFSRKIYDTYDLRIYQKNIVDF